MKLFSKMLTRKPDPKDSVGKIELEMDVEPLRKRSEPVADDSGRMNASKRFADDNDPPAFARDDDELELSKGSEEPEEAAGAGWGNAWNDADWDDEDDWGDEELDDDPEEIRALEEKKHLVGEIREAVGAVSHIQPEDKRRKSEPRRTSEPNARWTNDEEFGRKGIARRQLGTRVDGSEDRLLQETDIKFGDQEGSRRRSAMAHLKAAAKATKADRVLKHVVGRDPASDPDEQSPYRDDLAKVVRPRTTSRPISRPVSRPRSEPAPWDKGEADKDAALFAATSGDSLYDDDGFEDDDFEEERAERLARAPADLSAEDFADDNDGEDFFAARRAAADSEDESANSRFATGSGSAFESDDEDFDDDEEDFEDETFGDEAEALAQETTDDGFADEDEDDDAAWGNRFAAPEAEETDEADELAADGPVASSVVSDVVAMANAPDEDENNQIEDEIVRRKIAEMAGGSDLIKETTSEESDADTFINVAAAVTGRAGRSAGRVKTRLLGFQADGGAQDVFEAAKQKAAEAAAAPAPAAGHTQFPVGWIVVVEGPGRGACFTMYNGVSNIGRGEDQAVRLDFGDTSISRNNHAAVAYDDEQGKFFLGHGGKSNLVRLNGSPVLSTEEMSTGDLIRIGETTLRFVALCGEDFTWKGADKDAAEGIDD